MEAKDKNRPARMPDPSLVHGLVRHEEFGAGVRDKLPITWQETDYFEYNQYGGPLSEEFTGEDS